jgi:histidinol-phosphate/aromatic aminotransferase/cobyric acid decarboxylase-like protein
MRECVARVLEIREQFVEALRTSGFQPYPSAANFVLVPMAHAVTVARLMREQGIAVRPYHALRGIGDALRITVGQSLAMERALVALVAARDAVHRGESREAAAAPR